MELVVRHMLFANYSLQDDRRPMTGDTEGITAHYDGILAALDLLG
jgi:hypothetical protein